MREHQSIKLFVVVEVSHYRFSIREGIVERLDAGAMLKIEPLPVMAPLVSQRIGHAATAFSEHTF